MVNLVDVTIRGDDETGPAFASVAARAAALKRSLADAGKIRVGIDMSSLGTDLIGLRSKIQALGIADIADVNVQPGRIISQLQFLKRSIDQQKISDLLDVNVNQSELASQLASFKGLTATIPVNFDVSKIPNLPTLGPTQNISDKFQIIGIAQAQAQLDALNALTTKLDANLAALGAAAGAAAGSGGSGGGGLTALGAAAGAAAGGGGGGGGVAGLTAAAAAGGRALGGWGGILGGTIGLIQVWHVALDLAIEGLIAVGTAAAAAAIGIAAMTPAAQDIVTHLQAVQTVNSALGSSIPPLTGQFQALAQAMAPQVIEAYGGALNLITGQTGIFAKVASEVVDLFDTWIAKIDIWAKSQNNFGGLLQAGVGFLSQFGSIIAKIALALDNLIVKDPGTAHFLLDVLNAAASLLDLITKLPAPILETALAMHSWYVYGGAAAGVLAKLPGPLGAIGKALQGVNHLQLGVFAALAAGAFELVRAWGSASGSVQKDITNTLDALNQLSASQAIVQSTADIGHFSQEIQSLSTSSIVQSFKGWSSTFQELDDRWISMGHDFEDAWNQFTKSGGSIVGIFKDLGNAFNLLTGNGDEAQIATVQYQHDVAALGDAINKLIGSQHNLFAITGQLMQGTLAGGAATHSFANAIALEDLAGIRANDTLAVMQQKIANLVTGYQNMSVSGGILAGAVNAVTLASEVQSSKVTQLTGAYTAWFQLISGGVSSFDSFASSMNTLDSTLKLGTANMGGLTAAQITAQQQFIATANAAQTQFNSLVALASAAGDGQKGTDMLTQAMKDYMALLIPAAQGNSALRQTLVSMAQEVNPNITSFQQLTMWVGNVRNPMENLDGITKIFTRDAGTLTSDVQNLSTALGTTLNQAMATAITAATGGTRNFQNFASAILTTGLNSNATRTDALNLAEQLAVLTGSTSRAHDEFVSFAETALHLTQTQAETLWKQTLPGLQGFINGLHGKNIDITSTISGNGYVTITGSDGKKYQISAGGYYSPHAAGGMISDGVPFAGNQGDDVLISAKRGEAIIPVNKVPQLAPVLGAAGIPGFAGGGLVGSINNAIAQTEDIFSSDVASALDQATTVALNAAVASAKAQAAAAAAAAAQAGAHSGPGGGAPGANAALARRLYPQWSTGANWNAWNYVAMAESGWNNMANNPSSGAFGIAQALPYTKYPKAGWPPWAGGSANPTAQITWMAGYMSSRYGGPQGAAAHEAAYHWYDNGGWLPTGKSIAVNNTGAPERVVGPGGLNVTLEIGTSGNRGFDEFMLEWVRNNVRIKGGGDVQRAFGYY